MATGRTLARSRGNNAWFAAKYDGGVEPFLSAGHVQDVVASHVPPEQKEAIAAVIERLAGNTAKPGKTGAVVGNGGNLLGSGYGGDIDAHDFIFRMNNAATKNFEPDVGTRTTHHVLHSNRPFVRAYDDGAATILTVDDQDTDGTQPSGRAQYRQRVSTDLQWLSTQMFPGQFPAVALPFNPNDKDNYFPANLFHLPGGVRILHPAFMEYINERWFLPGGRAPSDYPSTGFKALILALHVCESVDVYGFGTNVGKGTWDHYYNAGEPLTGAPAAHRADFQEQFLAELEQHGVVRVFRGKS